MGRTALVTFEMVASAAEAMKAEKLDVVTRAVRERLGNIGSQGTVNKHLQTWKARQAQHVTSPLSLPPALQTSILDFMASELSNARQALESDLSTQQKEMADLATDNEKQFDLLEENTELIDTLRTDIATLQGKTGQLEINLAKCNSEVIHERENAQTAHTELAKALLRLEAMPRLEADIDAARLALDAEKAASRVALDKEHAARVAAEQSVAVAAAKLEAGNQRIQELTERLAKSEASSIKAQEKSDAAATDANEARSALQTERAAKVSAEQAAAVAIAKLDAANQRVDELNERLNKYETINIKALERIDATNHEVILLNDKIKTEQLLLVNAKKEIENLKKAEHKQIENIEQRKPGRPKKLNQASEPEQAGNDTDLQTIQLALQA